MTSLKALLPLTVVLFVAVSGCTSESDSPAEPTAAPAEQAPAPAPAPQPEAEAPAAPAAEAPAAAAAGEPPVEWIIWADGDPWDGPAPLTVEFECDLMEEVPQPTYAWDFGDGSPKSNEPHPKHTYAKPGQYTATCTVTDPSGGVGEDSVVIDVEAGE